MNILVQKDVVQRASIRWLARVYSRQDVQTRNDNRTLANCRLCRDRYLHREKKVLTGKRQMSIDNLEISFPCMFEGNLRLLSHTKFVTSTTVVESQELFKFNTPQSSKQTKWRAIASAHWDLSFLLWYTLSFYKSVTERVMNQRQSGARISVQRNAITTTTYAMK